MSRRTRAITAARNLLQRYAATQSAHKITYSMDGTEHTITGPDDIFITRMSVDWIERQEQQDSQSESIDVALVSTNENAQTTH